MDDNEPTTKGERTRARLVAAARSLLAEPDLGDLTTRNVATLCGVSRSLFHYHFRDRTELIVAVIEDIRDDWIIPFEDAVAGPGPFAVRAERVVTMLSEPETVDLGRVHAALHWFAQHDDQVRAVLDADYRRWRGCFVALFETLADERGGDIDPQPRGEALAAVADGLAAIRSLGAEVDVELTIRTLVDALGR